MFQSKDGVYWDTTIYARKVANIDFLLDMQSSQQIFEYLLVYNYPGLGPHCVYVKDYDRKTGLVECINSHGDVDQFPRVTMAEVLHIYRVSISGFERVKKASLPSTAPVPSLNKCVQNTHCSSVKGIVSDLDNCKRAETICKTWSKPYKNPTLCEVKEAAKLAEQGFLTSLKRIVLFQVQFILP